MSENQLKNQANASVGDETSESADAVLDGDLVRDATIAEFPQLVELSKQVPVVLDMWAPWCAPCRQLGPVLEQLVQEYAGKIALAKVNVDEQAELAQAFRVQSVPAVFLLLDGHPAPLFTGALPASTVRAAFDKVLELAASQGVAGRLRVHEAPAESLAPRETPESELPEALREAAKLVTAGEFAPAVKAYEEYVRENPEEETAVAPLLARARLGARVESDGTAAGVAAVERGNAAPTTDVPAQLAAADAELNAGNAVEALSRLLAVVRMTTGADREAARARMVEFFAILGDDPIVPAMRSRLATLLY